MAGCTPFFNCLSSSNALMKSEAAKVAALLTQKSNNAYIAAFQAHAATAVHNLLLNYGPVIAKDIEKLVNLLTTKVQSYLNNQLMNGSALTIFVSNLLDKAGLTGVVNPATAVDTLAKQINNLTSSVVKNTLDEANALAEQAQATTAANSLIVNAPTTLTSNTAALTPSSIAPNTSTLTTVSALTEATAPSTTTTTSALKPS